MENSEEARILSSINSISSPNEQDRQKAIQFLQSCTYQLHLLPVFTNILDQCITGSSRTNVYYCILTLRDIILHRGCLLSFQNHLNHINALLSIANKALTSISNDIAILNVFADAISVSCRFFFEQQGGIPQSVFDFYNLSIHHKLIATCTLISIINAIEKYLPHQLNFMHRDLMDKLKKKFSSENKDFYAHAFQSIISSPSDYPEADHNIIKGVNILGIELLIKTTLFDCDFDLINQNISFNIKDTYFRITNEDSPQ